MRDYSKPIKRQLRELSTKAYERELHAELAKLDQSFAEWRSGQITSGELSDRIHEFHNGPSRELFNRYNAGMEDLCVARAIVVGFLSPEDVPADVLSAVQDLIDFARRQD